MRPYKVIYFIGFWEEDIFDILLILNKLWKPCTFLKKLPKNWREKVAK